MGRLSSLLPGSLRVTERSGTQKNRHPERMEGPPSAPGSIFASYNKQSSSFLLKPWQELLLWRAFVFHPVRKSLGQEESPAQGRQGASLPAWSVGISLPKTLSQPMVKFLLPSQGPGSRWAGGILSALEHCTGEERVYLGLYVAIHHRAGTEAKVMEEHCFLACFLWLTQLPFIYSPDPTA